MVYYVFALAGAGILAIHFLNLHRTRQLRVPSIQFIKSLQATGTVPNRIRRYLILACRLGMVGTMLWLVSIIISGGDKVGTLTLDGSFATLLKEGEGSSMFLERITAKALTSQSGGSQIRVGHDQVGLAHKLEQAGFSTQTANLEDTVTAGTLVRIEPSGSDGTLESRAFIDTVVHDKAHPEVLKARIVVPQGGEGAYELSVTGIGKGEVGRQKATLHVGDNKIALPGQNRYSAGLYGVSIMYKEGRDAACDYRFAVNPRKLRTIYIDPQITDTRLRLAFQSSALEVAPDKRAADAIVTPYSQMHNYLEGKANLIVLGSKGEARTNDPFSLHSIAQPKKEQLSQAFSDLSSLEQAFETKPQLPTELVATVSYEITGYHIPIFKTVTNQAVVSQVPLGNGRKALVIQTGLAETESNLAGSEFFIPTLLTYLNTEQEAMQIAAMRLPSEHKSATDVLALSPDSSSLRVSTMIYNGSYQPFVQLDKETLYQNQAQPGFLKVYKRSTLAQATGVNLPKAVVSRRYQLVEHRATSTNTPSQEWIWPGILVIVLILIESLLLFRPLISAIPQPA